MNKLLIIPMFFLTMCGTAPVTPPAGACSLPLDGSPANCPDTLDDIKLPREELFREFHRVIAPVVVMKVEGKDE